MIRNYFTLFLLCLLFTACGFTKKTTRRQDEVAQTPPAISKPVSTDSAKTVDPNKALKEKYAKYLNVPADSIINIKLYIFIDKWLNTPYKWGGTDEKGIDCSAFIQRLLNDVYDLKIPRTSIEQLLTDRVEPFRSAKYLSEGDILFFKTMDDKIVSHVGIYLGNYMFVNSSSSYGVSIACLKDVYWRQRFVMAGRVRVLLARK